MFYLLLLHKNVLEKREAVCTDHPFPRQLSLLEVVIGKWRDVGLKSDPLHNTNPQAWRIPTLNNQTRVGGGRRKVVGKLGRQRNCLLPFSLHNRWLLHPLPACSLQYPYSPPIFHSYGSSILLLKLHTNEAPSSSARFCSKRIDLLSVCLSLALLLPGHTHTYSTAIPLGKYKRDHLNWCRNSSLPSTNSTAIPNLLRCFHLAPDIYQDGFVKERSTYPRTGEKRRSISNSHWHLWKLTIRAKGLSILYGADYFTEDEWIKLDGLIHKGNYVFTRGPQANILDEELMSFDDFEDTILSTPTPTPAQKELAPVPEPERRLPTPISENPSLNFSEPTQNEFSGSLPNDTSADTSAEASADEGSANVVPTSAEKVPEPPAAPASTPASAPAPANGGLVWYTQAQLDEVKAFNANLTKAGQKGGAKKGKDVFRHTSSASRSFHSPQSNYGSVEQDVNSRAPAWDTVEQTSTPQQPAWGNVEKGFVPEKPAWETASENPQAQIDDGFPSMAPDDISSVNQTFPTSAWPQGEQNDGNPSPTSVEQENRINSWADEVMDTAPVSVYESLVQEPLKSRFANGTDNFPQVIEKFIQVHGKQPRSTNDVFQPRNPEFKGPKRPDSRASVRTATRPVVPSKTRALHATNGSIFLAHANSPKRSNIAIEVKAGDSIRYIKYVSGIMHTGLNLRTNQQGQFPETVLEPIQSQVSLLQQQRAAAQNAFRDRGNTFTSALSHGLDRVESTNAAEWEKESEASRPTTSTTEAVAPMPLRTNAGLAGPRFAALAETESQDGGSERAGSLTQAEIRKIIREEVNTGLLLYRALLTIKKLAHKSPAAMHQRSRTVAQPEHVLTNIVPKTTTCWLVDSPNLCNP